MKNALWFAPALLALLVACPSGGTTTPPAPPPPPPPAPPTANGSPLSGTISNWIPGKTGNLRAVVFSASSTPTQGAAVAVSTAGAFSNLVLPTPAASDLTVFSAGSDCSGTVAVAPGDTRTAVALLTTAASLSASSGSVYESSLAVPGGAFSSEPNRAQVLRYYSDKSATISGSCTTTVGTPRYAYTYNVSLAAGWNIVNFSFGAAPASASDPIAVSVTSGAAASSVKFFQVLPEAQNIRQTRSDYAKKLFLAWDAVPDATAYTVELRSSALDLGNGVGKYGNPVSVAGTSFVASANTNTSYSVRVKTKFGTLVSDGAEESLLSTSTLNPDGLNILFPSQGIPYPVSVAAGSSQNIAIDLERGANCTQALTLTLDGETSSDPVGAASSTTISGVFTPNATTGSSSTLALSVGSSVPAGSYGVDVTATGCPTTVSTRMAVTVP